MMPSSPGPDEQRSSLRRWGPLAVIVVIVVIVGIVVVASRGGDDDKNTAAASASNGTSSASGTDAISWSEAKQQGRTDVTFPKTCDTSTGNVAIPNAFAQECFADQKAVT